MDLNIADRPAVLLDPFGFPLTEALLGIQRSEGREVRSVFK